MSDSFNINKYLFVLVITLVLSLFSWLLSAENLTAQDAYSLRYSDPYRAISLLEQGKENLKESEKESAFKSYYLLIHLYLKTEQYSMAESTFNEFQTIISQSVDIQNKQLQSKLVLIRAHLMLHNKNVEGFLKSLTPYLNDYQNKQSTALNTYYLYLLGSYQIQKTHFSKAIESLTTALEQAKALGHKDYILAISNQLVMIFYYTKQYDKGLNLSDKMIEMADNIDDRFSRVLALKNKMSLHYMRAVHLANTIGEGGTKDSQYITDMTKTNELQVQVIDQATSIKAYRLVVRAMIVKQNQSLSVRDNEQAVAIGKQTIAFAEKHQLMQEAAVVYNNMAIALRQLNEFEESIATLKKAESYYQVDPHSLNQEPLRWIYEDYALTYEMAGDFKKSQEYYKKFHQTSMSFLNKTKNQTLLELQEKYAAKEKNLEITRLNHQSALHTQQLKTEKMGRWLLSIILAGLIIIAIVLCQKRRKLKSLLAKEEALNQQVIELNKAKHRFFTNISHEFRTALTLSIGPLKNFLSKINQAVNDDCHEVKYDTKLPGYDAIETALENNLHMMTLLEEVLDIEKIDAKTLPIHISEVNIYHAVDTCLNRFQLQFKQNKISLNMDGFDKQATLFFDPSHLDKIISNILSNAGKYCVGLCSIDIKLVENEDSLVLEINDDGPGIEETELPHIFNRFYQGKSSIEKQLPGTGIGLSMVKELIELHHGKIEISSQIGKGSSIQLCFKKGCQHYSQQVIDSLEEKQQGLCSSDLVKSIALENISLKKDNLVGVNLSEESRDTNGSHSFTSSSDCSEPNKTDKKVILVVDDNADIRNLVKDILQPEYHIVEAENGKQAIKLAENIQPDLLIVDVMMPVMNGYQLIQVLRSSSELSHLSIILLSALADTPQKIHGLAVGADDYLTKPFDNDELRVRVKNHLAQKQRLSDVLFKNYKKQVVKRVPSSSFEGQDSKRSKQLDAIISKNLSQYEFGVEQMYNELNMTRSSLYRYTQKVYGCSPMNLLKKRRLELAYQMLTDYEGTISEVAYAVGYQSLSAFSRAFREHYERSPTKIRASKIELSYVNSPHLEPPKIELVQIEKYTEKAH